jgi:hypothetical protein
LGYICSHPNFKRRKNEAHTHFFNSSLSLSLSLSHTHTHRNWSRKINLGPSDYPTEFRLITAPLGNAPQFANIGQSSKHFAMSSIPRNGQRTSGNRLKVDYVPNFHKIAEIKSKLEQQQKPHSPAVEIESIHAGHTFDGSNVSRSMLVSQSPNETARLNPLMINLHQKSSMDQTSDKLQPPVLFTLGQKILAKYHGSSQWRKAKVSNIVKNESG